MSTPAPGWYPDPSAPGTQRYWDGTAWTDSTAPLPGYSAPREATELPVTPVAPAPIAAAYAPAHGYAAAPAAPQVGFGDAIKLGFRKYSRFDGRATRAEYWWWYLFTSLVGFVGYLVLLVVLVAVAPTTTTTATTGTTSTTTTSAGAGIALAVIGFLWFAAVIALLLPSIAVAVRRLHDTDRSGWWYLISFIPFGGIVLLIFFVTESTPGPNSFGPPSLGAAAI